MSKAGKKAVLLAAMAAGILAACSVIFMLLKVEDENILYASPTGKGERCTQSNPCSLTEAQAKVRSMSDNMTSDIIVNLFGGTYELGETMELSSQLGDSGTNGYFIIYQAHRYGTTEQEEPVLSGGKPITGWTLHDEERNIWKADVGELMTRQLYINGVRAYQARLHSGIPGQVTQSSTGYKTTSTAPQNWKNPSEIELIYNDGDLNGNWLWAEPRCQIASITGDSSSSTITMKQPCYGDAQASRNGLLSLPTAVENSYSFLQEPGTFYLDRSEQGKHVLYYIPRDDEKLETATVIAPILETLLKGTGTPAAPLTHVQFKGVTFADATWLRPSSPEGFADTGYNKVKGPTGDIQIGSAVWFLASHHILFEGNTFKRLGGAGLTFDNGSQFNQIIGNELTDISGNGIQIGNVNMGAASGWALVTDNLVKNNYIHHIGVEYPSAYAIWNAKTRNTTISHNTLAHLPRGGIASNFFYWWSHATVASGHRFLYNHIYDYMNNVRDGGGFDTNGVHTGIDGISPKSELIGNVFHNDHNKFGQIYFDFWTTGFKVINNIAYASASLNYNTINHDQQPCCNIHKYNFYDQNNAFKYMPNADQVTANYLLKMASMPASILQRAGVEAEYRHLLPKEPPQTDTEPPTAPEGVTVSDVQAGPSITVSWEASTDNLSVTGYEVDDGIEINDDLIVLAAVPGSRTSAVIEGLELGRTYHITVRAGDFAGNLSEASKSVTVTMPGQPELAGHWPFDQMTNNGEPLTELVEIASDMSGGKNDGHIANAIWTDGKFGNALLFDGIASTVNAGKSHLHNLDRDSFTLSAWFKSSDTNQAGRMISKGAWNDFAGYFLSHTADGAISLGIGSNRVQQNSAQFSTPVGFNDGQWHHVAAVVDRKNHQVMIYIDGEAQQLTKNNGYCGKSDNTKASIEGCVFLAASSQEPLTFGSYNGTDEFFAGSLDDVRIYTFPLTASEIGQVIMGDEILRSKE